MPLPEDGVPTEDAVYDTSPQFNPYDPPTDPEDLVQPTPLSPTPVEHSGAGDTSGADEEPPQGEQQGQQEAEAPEALPEFDPRYRDEFEGLLYLGRLTKTFRRFGHTFVVKTLTTEELAEIAQIVKPHAGGRAENAVYQSAFVAASVQSVDGQPLPGAITFDPAGELATVKFPYVMRNWMPPVREAIYNEVARLEITSREVLRALGEASG